MKHTDHGKIKSYLFVVFVCMMIFGCTKSENSILKDVSGVWRAEKDGTMITINCDEKMTLFAMGDLVIETSLGDIDKDNSTVNFKVSFKGKPDIITVKQLWDKEHKKFNLTITFPGGIQDNLSFVRKISSDDLNKFKNSQSAEKKLSEFTPDIKESNPTTQSSSVDESYVEKTGICEGLDISITSENLECLDRKYNVADEELNKVYKQLMSTLEDSKKSSLKKEQMSWIKEKESKCETAGKEVEGGSLEPVLIKGCFLQMTEKRLEYLKKVK